MIPSIQSLLDSTSKRFDEEFERSNALDGTIYLISKQEATTRRQRVKSFLLQSNLELLAAVREVIKEKDEGAYGSNFADGYHTALKEILTALSEGKENV